MNGTSATQAGPFSPRVVFLLLVVGVAAFVGLGVLTAYAPALKARGGGGGENALSRSAIGYAGLVQLLRAQGAPVVVGRGRRQQPGDRLTILTPPPGTAAKALAAVTPLHDRPVLVILPKWSFAPDPAHPGWAKSQGLADIDVISAVKPDGVQALVRRAGPSSPTLKGVGEDFLAATALPVGATAAFQTIQARGGEVVLADEGGRPVLVHTAAGPYVLSDPDLMNNHGLASLATARVALGVIGALQAGEGPVVFDVTLNGLGGSRSLLGLALSPPFLGASLCALATALLMGVHAAARFGPATPHSPSLALGKAALLDNTAMLIRLARREPKMGGRYAALVRRALGRRALSMGDLALASSPRSDAALDRLTPAGEPPFSQLAREAEQARDTTALMRAVRALHQRQTEILGERF